MKLCFFNLFRLFLVLLLFLLFLEPWFVLMFFSFRLELFYSLVYMCLLIMKVWGL